MQSDLLRSLPVSSSNDTTSHKGLSHLLPSHTHLVQHYLMPISGSGDSIYAPKRRLVRAARPSNDELSPRFLHSVQSSELPTRGTLQEIVSTHGRPKAEFDALPTLLSSGFARTSCLTTTLLCKCLEIGNANLPDGQTSVGRRFELSWSEICRCMMQSVRVFKMGNLAVGVSRSIP